MFGPLRMLRQYMWERQRRREQKRRAIIAASRGEALVQEYFRAMSALLAEGGLRTAAPDAEVRTTAHTLTHNVLADLSKINVRLADETSDSFVVDGGRKRGVLTFLSETGLLAGSEAIISLAAADLSYIALQETDLLRGADLRDANLYDANLNRAHLEGADLRGASLHWTRLGGAFLDAVNLQETTLRELSFSGAHLHGANLQGTLLGAYEDRGIMFVDGMDKRGRRAHGFSHRNIYRETVVFDDADVRDADFHRARLVSVTMRRTDLRGADLREALFEHVELYQADLRGADLRGATVSPDELAHARSLEGAILPDGTIHP